MSNIETVRAFLHAWDKLDLDAAFPMMSSDIVYKNTGYPDAFGHAGVRQALASLIDTGTPLTSVIHAIAETADGVVMTERTDTIHHAAGAVSFPVMGAFDVKAGLITGWRDYFDASLFKPA
ncbi:nuclear transport factor 2 family protein [Phenylobacterium sp. LjRoot219]|uniref:limonene-1,2-epoxide hydrolase family protein n=1 Tax=Phenylobacterium sp. LjRoot219 TaxID=3342283 RepID=UPI003ECCA4F4